MPALQDAANFQNYERSYLAKYPGQVGAAVRSLTDEVMKRLNAKAPAEAEAGEPEAASA